MNKKPNIFRWATSELSQDAFICWLLSWASYNEDKELFETAKYFINKLTNGTIQDFNKIVVKKQVNNIDVLCIIDDTKVILIEDKTNTKNHSNQLEKYYTFLLKSYSKENIFPVYLKTGDQSNFKSIERIGYKLFLRKDFLDVLNYGKNQGVTNSIFCDFNDYINNIESSVQSYKELPVKDWHWNSWIGFYSALQNQLNTGEWDYVPQKNGGFLGFWWHWKGKEFDGIEYNYYLQLEQKKFCFKLYPNKREFAEKTRSHYRYLLYKKAKEHNIVIYQNGRIGNYMTVAALTDSYIKTDDNGFLNMDKTHKNIITIQNMINEI